MRLHVCCSLFYLPLHSARRSIFHDMISMDNVIMKIMVRYRKIWHPSVSVFTIARNFAFAWPALIYFHINTLSSINIILYLYYAHSAAVNFRYNLGSISVLVDCHANMHSVFYIIFSMLDIWPKIKVKVFLG